MNKTLKKFRLSLCLLFPVVFIFKNTGYLNEDVKAAKTLNTSCTYQQKAQCVLWTAEEHRGTAFQRKFFTKYCLPALSRCTIMLWYQSYCDVGSHFPREGRGRPTIGEEKRTQIKEMYQSNPRRSPKEAGAGCGVHHTTGW